MIEKLDENKAYSTSPHEIIIKLNELIDAYNNHVHMSDGSPCTLPPQEGQ